MRLSVKAVDRYGDFTRKILRWHKTHQRPLPWKGSKDPYLIWLSEVILQQTRVRQGIIFYKRFVRHFPTVHHLARAPSDKVMKLWQGLGYYRRAQHLHGTAQTIVNEFGGQFPDDIGRLKQLKGIGTYTAAAIASFAFNQPHAVVDGNVVRVLARAFGLNHSVDTAAGRSAFHELAYRLLDKKRPADFNQAIMDFGATVCKPKAPDCMRCFFRTYCFAYRHNAQAKLPARHRSVAVRRRYLNFIVFRLGSYTVLTQRHSKDIYRGLYVFPLLESRSSLTPTQLMRHLWRLQWLHRLPQCVHRSPRQMHRLSHQELEIRFWELSLAMHELQWQQDWLRIGWKQIQKFPVPVFCAHHLENRTLAGYFTKISII